MSGQLPLGPLIKMKWKNFLTPSHQHELDKFLGRHKLPKQTQAETENQKSPSDLKKYILVI